LEYCGTGKAVNTGDEDFIFTRCHRGYGGVAILWSKCIDPLVKLFKEGNSRIQCIELKTNIPILCISTYLPTKVENDRYEEYSECIDQIFEIIQKYQNSHEIVIGGDFNEDISKNMYLIIIQLNLSLSVR
jgi:exonuclease III